jgi:hypothetical protein
VKEGMSEMKSVWDKDMWAPRDEDECAESQKQQEPEACKNVQQYNITKFQRIEKISYGLT